jgi:predicted DNA-binding transcriptional regulator AlpA
MTMHDELTVEMLAELKAIRAALEAGHSELLDRDAVAALLGVSTATIDRMRAAGDLPEPVSLRGAVRWRRRELLRWIEEGCPAVS